MLPVCRQATVNIMTDESSAAIAHRRYMAGLGLSVALISTTSMILNKSIPSPYWLAAAVNALVVFVGFYPLRYIKAFSSRSARPTLLSIIVTSSFSLAACALVIVLLGNDIPAYLIAGGAILGVWSLSAWRVGRT
jgi:hypothetical protein